jgi:hypothetical protein
VRALSAARATSPSRERVPHFALSRSASLHSAPWLEPGHPSRRQGARVPLHERFLPCRCRSMSAQARMLHAVSWPARGRRSSRGDSGLARLG